MTDFDYAVVRDPRVFRQNRLDAHSDHLFYLSPDALPGDPSDCRMSLQGIWKFRYAENYKKAVTGFEKEYFSVEDWDDIRVPGHIQLQGYGHPQYVNEQYPWDGHEALEPGEIPERFNPVGTYVRMFDVPERFRGHTVHLVFQGAESGIAVWMNGTYVGYSEDSFTPSAFDVTPYLKENGANRLAVQVFRWTSGSWCEDQDFFRFSGIFRDVELVMQPDVHMEDIRILTDLNERFTQAVLKIRASVNGEGTVRIRLYDSDRKSIIDETRDLSKKFSCDFPVDAPQLWSAEEPALYDLRLDLSGSDGVHRETVWEKVGFRRFEIRDGLMLLNGQRIVFHGVNRHEFCAEAGRCITADMIRRDLITMKRNNINAVRTSHYPNQTALYRLCDALGLYVIDETNLEAHGTWDPIVRGMRAPDYAVPGDRPEFLQMVLDRAASMYERDKNHPCILIWSCGNESFGGRDIYEMSRYFHRVDRSRIVHYEGIVHDRRYNDTSDVESTMYEPVAHIRDFLRVHRDKPYISCEYSHAMGNSCGGLKEYTDLTDEEPLYQGGFIWDFIDQSLTARDCNGRKYQAYGGDFDDRPTDYSFSGDGLCYAEDRDPSPKMQEVRWCYQTVRIRFDGMKATIANKNLFINLNRYRCVMTLAKDGEVMDTREDRLDVPPCGEHTVDLPFTVPEASGEYVITISFCLAEDTAWAERGYEVAFGQTVIDRTVPAHPSAAPLTVTEGFNNVGIRGGEKGREFEILFSATEGGPVSYRYAGRELLKRTPRPNFWRAITDNDRENLLIFRGGQWRSAGLYATQKTENGRGITPYRVERKKDTVCVTYTLHLPTVPAKDCTVTYCVDGEGTVRTTLSMDCSDDVGVLREFSMLFTMDASYDDMTWYGLGPEDTYPDRRQAKLGIYHKKVTENMARYLVPQECGNREDVRYARVTDKSGHGLLFTSEGLDFSALPYRPEELETAAHSNELPPVLFTCIRIGRQAGVGGDDTWGADVLPPWRLDNSRPLSITFSFRGI